MIREASPTDRPTLRAIQATALDEPWPALLDASIDGPPLLLVCERDDGAPAGYALAVRADESAYVAELAVAPALQGEGYGSSLLAAVLDRLGAAGVATVRLTARAADHGLRSFYAGFGFEVRERLPGHYEDGDGVLLEAELGP